MRNLVLFAILTLTLFGACKKGGEIKTKNGFRFVNHTNVSGPKAQPGELVKFHINFWVNDSLVRSTRRDLGKPNEAPLPDTSQLAGAPPSPVLDALMLMAKGDSITIYQPVDSTMKGGIPPAFGDVKEFRFDIVLVDIVGKEEVEKQQAELRKKAEEVMARAPQVNTELQTIISQYKGKKLGDKLQKLPSGLELVIHDKGAGAPVKEGDQIETHYYGVLQSTGKMFDNSFERGEAPPFMVGGMIPGFNEGMMQLNRGGKATLFIPSALGYGAQGAGADIPANADLVFYIELGN